MNGQARGRRVGRSSRTIIRGTSLMIERLRDVAGRQKARAVDHRT